MQSMRDLWKSLAANWNAQIEKAKSRLQEDIVVDLIAIVMVLIVVGILGSYMGTAIGVQ